MGVLQGLPGQGGCRGEGADRSLLHLRLHSLHRLTTTQVSIRHTCTIIPIRWLLDMILAYYRSWGGAVLSINQLQHGLYICLINHLETK